MGEEPKLSSVRSGLCPSDAVGELTLHSGWEGSVVGVWPGIKLRCVWKRANLVNHGTDITESRKKSLDTSQLQNTAALKALKEHFNISNMHCKKKNILIVTVKKLQ